MKIRIFFTYDWDAFERQRDYEREQGWEGAIQAVQIEVTKGTMLFIGIFWRRIPDTADS